MRTLLHASCLFILSIVSCCNNPCDKNRMEPQNIQNFKYDIKWGNMILETVINDTLPCRLLFDTGAGDILLLTSDFTSHLRQIDTISYVSFLTATSANIINAKHVTDSIVLSYDNVKVSFPDYYIIPPDSHLSSRVGNLDGIIGLPAGVKSIEIAFSDKVIRLNKPIMLDSVEYSFPISRTDDNKIIVRKFPLSIFTNSRVISYDSDYLFDTGYRGDFIKYSRNFNEDIDLMLDTMAVFKRLSSDGIVNIVQFNDCGLFNRNIWIEYNNRSTNSSFIKAAIGLESLKSFDIYIDLITDIIHLNRINYTPLIDEADSTNTTQLSGRYLIDDSFLSMYIKKNGKYDIAGIRPGDVIIKANGHTYAELKDSIALNLLNAPITLSIKRGACLLDYNIQ